MKLVIIGGVAAGMSVAAKLKRERPDYEIVVLERGYDVSYGACGLPYYISGVTEDLDSLRIRRPEDFIGASIDLRLGNEALGLDPKTKTIRVLDQDGLEYLESYDKCVIATGAEAIRPGFPGIDLRNVFTLSNLVDGERVRKAALDKQVENVVIVGGGPIGIELVESFQLLGKKVTLVEMADQILNNFDQDMAIHVERALVEDGVDIRTNEGLEEILGQDRVEAIRTNKGQYKADMVVLALGVRPNTGFVRDLDLKTLPNGALIVNERMETSLDDIYAAGDCASVYHRVLGEDTYIALGTNANKQGRFLAEILAGMDSKMEGVLGSSMLKVNDLECAATGINEKQARAGAFTYGTNTIRSKIHSSYYPGNEDILIKIVYDLETRKLLGAQLIGRKGVALRMNTLAMAIYAGLAVEDLAKVDLGYAPPYSSPWDPIHIVGQTVKD